MNGFLNKFKNPRTRNKSVLSLAISIVILIEVIGIAFFAVQAWVETVSSIKITNETNTKGTVGTYVFTDATIGSASGTIDIADYFKQSGDMHLAPASSADGTTFFFPKVYNYNSQNPTYVYRKGNSSDKNTAYLSVTFRLKADTNADFFFTKTPAITVENDIRVSVTAYTEGTSSGDLYDAQTGLPKYTKIYANNASTTPVVNSTTGATGATTVEKFTDHEKGKSSTARLFAVGANETKIVTVNVWLQKDPSIDTDLTTNMAVSKTINNLGITSSLTPRHVTLLPTPTWDDSGATFYAWCWDAPNNSKSRLYKLELDDNEHYSFDYNGTFRKAVFVRAVPNCTVQPGEYDSWPFSNNTASGTNGFWNQTVNTSIPNDPIDPTYIIETISSGSQVDSNGNTVTGLSTGSWHDPATVKVAYVTDQSSWGAVSATSYIGSNTSSHVMEQTNTNNPPTVHTNTVHAWPGKTITLKAEPATNYAFVGWYTNEAGTGTAASTNATFTTTAPSTASEVTYYAKFKETRTLTIIRTLDGNVTTSTTSGTIKINDATTNPATVDKGSSVTFEATAATGYTFSGFYTAATEGTEVTSQVTLNSNTTYYARFTTNYYLKASWNSWSETQDQLTGTGNELTFVQELDPGQYQFKIFGGGSDWSNAYEYKYNYNGSTYFGASGDDTLNSSNTTGYMKLNTGTTAKYTFHFNKSTKEFWITSNVDCHVVGDITGGWSTGDNNKMTRVGSTNEYTFTVKVNGSKSFKILTSSGTWYGNGYRYHDDYYGASGGDTFNTPGTNCTMDGSNKDYVFHFDISTQKFWITDP